MRAALVLGGAMLAALSAFWVGRRLYDHRTGVFAGALVSVSLLLASEGGIAKTDAMLLGLTTLGSIATFDPEYGGAIDAPLREACVQLSQDLGWNA